jgi:REP element-mobilizing transposase RayT
MKLFATKHSHAELYVHVVWATKERAPVLSRKLLFLLSEQSTATARKLGAAVLAFGGTSDHVHVLLRYRPDLTVSDLLRKLKSALTRTIRRDVRSLPDFSWQTGYGAFSVSTSDLDRVVAYIASQEQHHQAGTVWPDMDFED